MHFLVTGVAGFIGAGIAKRLLENGHEVTGVDHLGPYYSVALKRMRLARLHGFPRFTFHQLDLAEPDSLQYLPGKDRIDRVIHLAAQAGVRHSMQNPHPYVSSNIDGHLTVLEFCRRARQRPDLIYASSSSVYGETSETVLREEADVGAPASLYAVTKRTDEMMSQAYADLYGVVQTGLRFFTIYGPWGRPDMAYWIFTSRALKGEPIQLFNNGNMARDFTYIDDALDGLYDVATAPRSPSTSRENTPHRVFNLGSGRSEPLQALVDAVASATGVPLKVEPLPMQPGDVKTTCADITRLSQQFGYRPSVQLADGIQAFVDWFRSDPEFAQI